MAISVLKQVKRRLKMIGGVTLLLVGAAMLVLPGPGIVTIFVGLTILSTEFLWARLLLDRLKRRVGDARRAAGRRRRR